MKTRHFPFVTIAIAFASVQVIALLISLTASAEILVDLDASSLSLGAIREWKSSLPADGNAHSDAPLQVEKTQGRNAVIFDGTQQFIASFTLPAGFEKKPFTVEVWVLNPKIDKAETVIAFVPEKGGPGTEFNFSSGPTAGAFRSGFKATTPFTHVPLEGAWHHLAWTHDGSGDSTLRVYVDGELDTERALKFTLPVAAKIHIGGSGEPENKARLKGFSGAIARVRIQDKALTQAELRAGAGLRMAFAPEPRNEAATSTLNESLRWQSGVADVASFVIYAGTDRAAVERGDHALAKPTTKAEFGPLALNLGATYFWRVDELDKAGHLMAPGNVWSFNAAAGLVSEPQPRDHDSNISPTVAQLAWHPGNYATRQRIFFGTSADEVEHATKPVTEIAAAALTCPIPAKLAPGTRYFWRVDSDNGQQAPSRGPLWSFRTQDTPVKSDVTFFVGSDCHYGRENNAAINRRVIDEMNALPGTPLPASVGGGFVRTPRGVVLNGDLLDEGFNKETATALWAEFCRDYGLTGTDGRLCFPAYEGFGNHDGGPTKSIVRAGIKERNKRRVGLKVVAENSLHYAWDWDQLHLAQLNLFGGSGPADVKGVNGPDHDPEASLEFLKTDLAQNVGTSGRPVIVFQHFGWLGGMSDWWQAEAKERFYEAVKNYNIACLMNGHSHGNDMVVWHDLLTIHDGATARGDGDTGDFLVVHVTDKELIVIQRKLGSWGVQKRKLLNTPVTLKP